MLNHQSGQMADGAIFRYYGLGPSLKIDVDHFTIEESDRILLLSDGVTKVFHPSEAAKFVEEYLDISTTKGKNLLSEYNITAVPTVILSKEIQDYNAIKEILEQAGSFEKEGVFVFRKLDVLNAKYKKL